MEPTKKFNWGTLILGLIIGAAVVGIIVAASKPAVTGGQAEEKSFACKVVTTLSEGRTPGGQPLNLSGDVLKKLSLVAEDLCLQDGGGSGRCSEGFVCNTSGVLCNVDDTCTSGGLTGCCVLE
ncbi:hypothetical protein A3A09_00160 [Candidatus Nomurabacteria bacterium RIFCSPLOWO2_01_FULL_42_20]|uniref:Uncharacterized protein n=1 Tax=Candidatus Nomurabacteria bacterium RIFCSPHIGHO2_01_FULL_42_16 TaxID=1801743 RepID=A0A1F6VIP2_9BACT|nr:MAG: hypothetical protein A2824_03510 [Candidatus Nomurabacteria bacterium RIFCSPHIGHO2_01_FULL_42_16]OGI91214.1 MAG: hypothetical protein A3A09_00160 [Candidatus Nomurabacteria bacterium RIFCSPLOWO2_01_FULL_42_20]